MYKLTFAVTFSNEQGWKIAFELFAICRPSPEARDDTQQAFGLAVSEAVDDILQAGTVFFLRRSNIILTVLLDEHHAGANAHPQNSFVIQEHQSRRGIHTHLMIFTS